MLRHKFQYIFDLINEKSKSTPSRISRLFLSLKSKVLELQDHCRNFLNNQSIRDESFSKLSHIYLNIATDFDSTVDVNEMYDFLWTINEKLVDCLKLSNLGSGKLRSDSCRCSEGKCISPVCTTKCIKTCSAEYKLTRYFCRSKANFSVPLENICDGNKDCPNGDDEVKCIEG